jgi:hypothetical protein
MLLLTLTLAFAGPVHSAAGAGNQPAGGTSLFLPFVAGPLYLGGRMTDHGTGAAGVPLSLIFYDGNHRSTIRSFETDSNGYYRFNDLPPLAQFQYYSVHYTNTSDPSRVREWETRDHSLGYQVDFGSIDLADIAPVTPTNGMTVTFPVTFQWTTRPWSPNDTYMFRLRNPSGTIGIERNGLDDHTTLDSLPNGFQFGQTYLWEIWIIIYDQGTSFGYSYHTYEVQFSN